MIDIGSLLNTLATIIGVAFSAWVAIIMFILVVVYLTANHDGD